MAHPWFHVKIWLKQNGYRAQSVRTIAAMPLKEI
jgi:hypothetical protein